MKLLIDMNLRPAWVTFLGAHGIKAAHWSSVGPADAPDTGIVAFAKTNDYVILTNDLDFAAILATTRGEKPSAIIMRSDTRPDKIGEKVVAALRVANADLERGALIIVEPHRSRVRLLPLV